MWGCKACGGSGYNRYTGYFCSRCGGKGHHAVMWPLIGLVSMILSCALVLYLIDHIIEAGK